MVVNSSADDTSVLPHRIDRFEIDQQGIHDATHFDQLSPLATVADEARHFTTDRRSSRARRVPLDPQAVEAIRYSTDPVNRRLVTRADGVVTFDEINAHLDDEQRNRDLDRPELIDARGATTDLTTEQVRELVRRAADMLRLVELGPTTIVTAR